MDYLTEIRKNSRIQQLEARIRKTGSMKDVQKLASETGKVMAQVIGSNLKEIYPNGQIADADVRAIVSPVMKANHKYVSELSAVVINMMYEKAGVGLKAVIPEYDTYRETGLVWEIANRSFRDGFY